ncbi:MAG: hypothetical protein HY306_06585 [Nitrosomonadales bacterium]|nr:hypothetical protein [Nitrosomonadales bacterium]
MFSWLNKLERKADHPMSDVDEARALLAGIPKDNPFKALDEVTAWLDTFKDAQGFRLDRRFAVARLLDETGQLLYAELLKHYLASPHLQDFHGMMLWRASQAFLKALAASYAMCLHEYRQEEKKPLDIREQLPVISVRLLRAIAERMKLDLMRYIEVEQEVWDELYRQYHYAEENQFSSAMVYAYAGHVIHTSPQRELLCALGLYAASPGTLAADQIEVASRITARMVSLFDFKTTADGSCIYSLDLAHPAAPSPLDDKLQASPDMRFFGMTRAIPRLEEIAHQNERGTIPQEHRFGNEFTPDGKLTVLRHLQLHWSGVQPHRYQERHTINTAIKVVHGFKVVSKLVTHVELGHIPNLSAEDAAMLKQHTGALSLATEEIDYSSEDWTALDVSTSGFGGLLPKTAGPWVKIGALCGISDQNAQQWWVGMVRRLHTDEQNKVHVGIEMLARKPLSVWLRILGKGKERVSNWETSSGSFAYDYLPVILLPDAHNSYLNATMLMESQSYVPDSIYEMMMGEKSRNIKLTKLLAEGDDYEQVEFEWLGTE